MPLFAVIGLDDPPHSSDRRNAARAEHRAYVVNNDAPIVLTGPFLDDDNNQCGSFYIFEADNEQQIRKWLEREPFFAAGVYGDLIIRRFATGMNRLPMKDWPVTAAAGRPK